MKALEQKETKIPRWRHPGGKLRDKGAESLTDAELLAILISTGIKGKPVEMKDFKDYKMYLSSAYLKRRN